LVSLSKPLDTLRWLEKQGFTFSGTSSHKGTSLFKYPFAPRSILAMGSESKGVNEAFLKNAICIPGTGTVESLNVSVATALCVGEYSRQHRG
jgi:tRNA G18 (ribose-2'-O)-methylase SpoU